LTNNSQKRHIYILSQRFYNCKALLFSIIFHKIEMCFALVALFAGEFAEKAASGGNGHYSFHR